MRSIWIAAFATLLPACDGDPISAAGGGQTEAAAPGRPAAAITSSTAGRRVFRDWTAVCDNGGRCMAYSGSGVGGWLAVRLDAGPDAEPVITMDLPEMSGTWLTLVIDERPQGLISPDDSAVGYRVPYDQLPNTLVRLAAARDIKLVSRDLEIEIPASGASAAMLWIDERQGRLGTRTALVRRGGRPASAVRAAPVLPTVVAAPAVSQTGFGDEGQTLPATLEALPAVKACRAETSFSEDLTRAVMSARLDASTELWAVPCFSGAYNVGHDWYVTGPGGRNPRGAALSMSDGAVSNGTVNGGYSAGTRTIEAFSKGRGLGDCGVASQWTWTGRTFVLTREAAMEDCEGLTADAWPTTWRTR